MPLIRTWPPLSIHEAPAVAVIFTPTSLALPDPGAGGGRTSSVQAAAEAVLQSNLGTTARLSRLRVTPPRDSLLPQRYDGLRAAHASW